MATSSSDLDVRADRLRALTLGRATVAVALFAWLSTFGRGLVLTDAWVLLSTAGVVHLAVQVAGLTLPHRRPRLTRPLTEVALLVDVGALAVVLAATGGTHSPLAALLVTQVLAVTLLFGRWAGLRAALLGSIAVVWLLTTTPLVSPSGSGIDTALTAALDATTRGALLLAVLWATTAITGWLSGVTERELRGRTEDLTLLREITPDLDPRQGPERVAQAVTEVVVERLGHTAAALWLPPHDATGPLQLTGRHGTRVHPSLQDVDPQLPVDHEVVATAGASITPLPDRAHPPAAFEAVFDTGAPLLLAPLHLEDRQVGLLVIEVRSRARRRAVVRPRQLRVLRMLTEQASLLLDNARLQAVLADQATRDALTGLPNHRFFQQRLGEELDRVARRAEHGDERAVTLALLDLDRFKAVNDTYGHLTGDRVLAAVGRAAAQTLRETDVVCRYGGEEFAAVLVDADADAARVTVERLRAAISALPLQATDGTPLEPVTASVGIATVVGTRETRAAVIDRADTALYAAKRAGRDRAVHHADLPVVDLDATPGAPATLRVVEGGGTGTGPGDPDSEVAEVTEAAVGPDRGDGPDRAEGTADDAREPDQDAGTDDEDPGQLPGSSRRAGGADRR